MHLAQWATKGLAMVFLLTIFGVGAMAADVPENQKRNPPADAVPEAQLAEALTFYYQEDYHRALPLFKAVAEHMDNKDLSFWIATCAASEKEYDLAVHHFRKMLSQDPELHRVRLDLADVLIKTGDTDAARTELETVKKSAPPSAVMENIEKRLKLLDQPSERFTVSALLTQGLQFDDNFSSGPGSIYINDAIFPIIINRRHQKTSGKSWLTGFSFNSCYDPGRPKEFMWNSSIYFYNSHNLDDYPEYNYLTVDFLTGPWWVAGGNVMKLPLGFNDKYFGNERLSNSLHIDPSIEHFLSPQLSIVGAYSLINETFAPRLYQSSDHQHHRFSFGPSYYVDKQNHMASGFLGYEKHAADSDYLTYDSAGLTLSYVFTFSTGTEAKILYNWAQRRYEEAPPLYDEIRKDQRNLITFSLNQRFMKFLFASLELCTIDNRSNADLFSYRKNLFAMNIGVVY